MYIINSMVTIEAPLSMMSTCILSQYEECNIWRKRSVSTFESETSLLKAMHALDKLVVNVHKFYALPIDAF